MRQPETKSWRPPGRVWALTLCAATLAFIDGEHLARHVIPTGAWATLIHPALFVAAILCLVAVYVDGATPTGPWGRGRRYIGFRVAGIAAVALGLGQEILSLLEMHRAAGMMAFAAALVLGVILVAILILAIFAPAIAMRSGFNGLIGHSWRAMRRHWLAVGIRAFALVPVPVVAIPIAAYWRIDEWTLHVGTSPEAVRQIQHAIDMCNTVGIGGIAWSAFATIGLLGLFLWWMGRSTGVLLDREE